MNNKAAALHILVKTEAEAQALKTKIEKGADFSTLAKNIPCVPQKSRAAILESLKRAQW